MPTTAADPTPGLIKIMPSNVNALECSRKYNLLYMRHEWPAREHEPIESVAIGTAVHDCLRAVYADKSGVMAGADRQRLAEQVATSARGGLKLLLG